MRGLLVFILFVSGFAMAHEEHHHEALEANPTLSGASVLQLTSPWKNQDDKAVKLSELRGQPRLVVMLFTQCKTACPLIIEDLKTIYQALETLHPKKFSVSIFSLDSFRETPQSLKEFAQKQKLPKNWSLYTSDADAVSELAAALGLRYKRLPNGDYIHSNMIYFLNAAGEVKATKEGIKTPAAKFIKQIAKDS